MKDLSVKKRTPLPWQTFLVLLIVIFSEPMTFTVIFPFMYYMVKDFKVASNEKEIGSYAGWIASSYSIAQLVTSVGWGTLSDRVGRKPVLLVGLCGNFLSMIAFGFSKTFGMAIVTRSFCGMLNGNMGVAKCVLGEISDSTNEAFAFSMLSLVFCLGNIIGPLVGGFLSDPVRQYGNLFGNSWFFETYPYILPCLVSAFVTLSGLVIGGMGFKETLKKKVVTCGTETTQEKKPKSNNIFSLTKQNILTILAYGLIALVAVLFDELFPLWTAMPLVDGGLSFLEKDIGIVMSIMGGLAIFIQLLIYPNLARCFSFLFLYRIGMILLMVTAIFCPFIPSISNSKEVALTWVLVCTATTLRTIGGILCFTSIMIMVNKSGPKSDLGIVNGYGQMCASLVRAIGPASAGTLWSWSLNNSVFPFDKFFMFIVMGLLAFVAVVHSFWVESVWQDHEEDSESHIIIVE